MMSTNSWPPTEFGYPVIDRHDFNKSRSVIKIQDSIRKYGEDMNELLSSRLVTGLGVISFYCKIAISDSLLDVS